MTREYFQYKQLLLPPIRRAAYSDRTAWLMSEMSALAYLLFENNDSELKKALDKAGFSLLNIFDCAGTQAFLAKRIEDKMAVLAFRGTQKEDVRDIITDLNAKFYMDAKKVKIHDGFNKAFACIEEDVKKTVEPLKDYALYITGHSLGGALALIATRILNSDNLAACYTFGSPKVGILDFEYDIKPPIYRIVNAYDIVPVSPPTYIFDFLAWLPFKNIQVLVKKYIGYEHHGDMRYLWPCADNLENLRVSANFNEFKRLFGIWINRKKSVKCHDIDIYCAKLARWAEIRQEFE